MAVTLALEEVTTRFPYADIRIFSDLLPVVRGINGEWNRSAHPELWEQLATTIANHQHPVTCQWLPKTTDNKFKQRADQLARGNSLALNA